MRTESAKDSSTVTLLAADLSDNVPIRKTMKTYWFIKVYITTDQYGEWWETLKTDGSTRMWQGNTAVPLKDKEFKSLAAAQAYAEKNISFKFQIVRNDPPVPLSTIWIRTVEYESTPNAL